jgi:hypothetical protein
VIGARHRGRLFKIRDTGARVPKNLDESRFGNPREVQMDDRNFEQELASARLTVEDLARAGDLSAVDQRTLLLGLSALEEKADRDRVEASRERASRFRLGAS